MTPPVDESLLKAKQIQILRLIVDGRTYKEIAGELDCSTVMVRYWMARSMRTYGCRTCPQLMYRYGFECGANPAKARKAIA